MTHPAPHEVVIFVLLVVLVTLVGQTICLRLGVPR
jgi:hypothetical protein